VAKNRGVSIDTVLKDMADGRDFMGKDALAAGLVDHIGTFDDAYRLAKGEVIEGIKIQIKKEEKMDINILKADHREVFDAVFQQGADSVDTEKIAAEARTEGVDSERKRVTDILAADADPEVTRKAIADGTSADGAFKLFYQAEKDRKAAGLEDLRQNATESQGNDTPPEPSKLPADVELTKRAGKLAAEKGISIDAAMSQVMTDDPELAARYEQSFA